MPDSNKIITAIDEKIEKNPALDQSNAVQFAWGSYKLSNEALSSTSSVIDQLNKSLDVFTDPSSSPMAITSSALTLTSKALYATGAGAPLGLVIGLLGSIFGALGGRKKTDFLSKIQKMIDESRFKQELDEANASLSGAMNLMLADYQTINDIIDYSENEGKSSEIPPDSPLINDFSVSRIIGQADDVLGSTFKYLSFYASVERSETWKEASQIYKSSCVLIGFKAMYLYQAAALFQYLDKNTPEPTRRRDIVLSCLKNRFPNTYFRLASPFFVKPDLLHAGITNHIYRLDEHSFRLIAGLFVILGQNKQPTFPNGHKGNYRFSVEGHNGVSRLTTLYRATNKVLKHDYRFHGSNPDNPDSYFGLYADTDDYSPQAYYRWYLSENNKNTEFFLFEVTLTASDIKGLKLPEDKANKYKNTNSMLIFGTTDPGKDEVWISGSDSHDSRQFVSYQKVIKDKFAQKSLWLLLGPTGMG